MTEGWAILITGLINAVIAIAALAMTQSQGAKTDTISSTVNSLVQLSAGMSLNLQRHSEDIREAARALGEFTRNTDVHFTRISTQLTTLIAHLSR